jgi:RNA polymerase-binding transcription factor DksA
MMKQVNERALRQLRARFWQVLARYRTTQRLIEEELASREIEEVENATELWDSAVLSALSDADLAALADVFAALRRVADGTYGRCLACGDPIAIARLHALPEASHCIDCAGGAERRGWARVAQGGRP